MFSVPKNLLGPGGLGWKELASRVWKEVNEDDVFNRAAVLGFFLMLALFPLLLSLTALLGLVVQNEAELRASLLSYLGTLVPRSASELIYVTVDEITSDSGSATISFGLLAALWAASSGMLAIIDSLNIAYHISESRPWWKSRLVAIGLTVTLMVLIISALVLLLSGTQMAERVAAVFRYGETFLVVWGLLQWLIVLASVFLAFFMVYYYAPNLREQKLCWVLPGMIVGVALWLTVSFGFRLYLQYFNTYNKIYGSLGAVIILMLWFYLTGIAILIGGEVNSEVERAAAEAGVPDAKLPGQKSPKGETILA